MTNERIKVLLNASRLPEVAISKHFKESLLMCSSEMEAEALIEKRRQLVENVRKEFREKHDVLASNNESSDEELAEFADTWY